MLMGEAPSGNVNLELHHNQTSGGTLFVRDDSGQVFRVYQTAEDAVNDNHENALAVVCYGWFTFLYEGKNPTALDDFLDDCWERSSYYKGVEDQFGCHETGKGCEDAFHAIQVKLENEECSGCEACRDNGVGGELVN